MRLHVILPLNKLQQLENLEADDLSLELSFEEGVYTYCELQFITVDERTRFIEVIMRQHESVEKSKNEKIENEPMNQLKRQMEDISTLLLSMHQKKFVKPNETKEAIDRLTASLKIKRRRARR